MERSLHSQESPHPVTMRLTQVKGQDLSAKEVFDHDLSISLHYITLQTTPLLG